MDTAAPTSTFRHTRVLIQTTSPTEFIDITDQVHALVDRSGFAAGLVNIQCLHTTTALLVNEHEPQLLTDFAALMERMAPAAATYRHDDVGLRCANLVLGERPNGHAHCRALFLAPSVCLNVLDGRLQLGTWQRIFLVELDGPRTREVSLLLIAEAGR